MTTKTPPEVVEGLLFDVPEDEYHAGLGIPEESLSVSGAKILLDCPARYRWAKDHPEEVKTSDALDFGTLAHKKVLGVGQEVAVCPPDKLAKNGAASTTAAKEWIAEQTAAGVLVMRQRDLDVVDAMATQLERSEAGPLLVGGTAEVSMVWRDDVTGVLLRGRIDYLTEYRGVPIAVDYKTTASSADPRSWRYEAKKYHYPMQDPWYREGLERITGDPHGFVFVVQEKTAPYLVSVVELDDDAREVGTLRNLNARSLFADCHASGDWPAYPGITRISIPNYTA